MNVLAYPDGFVLFCSLAIGLRNLIRKFESLVNDNYLVLNADKTKTMVFHRASSYLPCAKFTINDSQLEQVDEFKYLGSILNSSLHEKSDVNRIFQSFNRSAGAFIRKFGTLELELKNRLFDPLCLSMYGLEVFMSKRNCVSDLKKLGVAYHFAVKRLLGLPKYFSNHYACGLLNRFTFEHLMNFRALRFFFWLSKCASPCFSRYKTYFLNKSILSKYVNQIFVDEYSVTRIIDNDYDALVSRILYVQGHEHSSFYGLIA